MYYWGVAREGPSFEGIKANTSMVLNKVPAIVLCVLHVQVSLSV